MRSFLIKGERIMNKLKYEIKPTSTVSKAYPHLRFELEKTILDRIAKEYNTENCSIPTFRHFLEIEIDNLQSEINYLLHTTNREMSQDEYQLIHKATSDASIASLIALELYAELA